MRRIGAVALLFVAACGGAPEGGGNTSVTIDTGSGRVVVHVEVADDPREWARGLMHRDGLADDAGMLFVFTEPREHAFWMKDTLIALDLISIRNGRVVDVATMDPCRADPCPRTSTPVIDAALEVKAGTAERAGIRPGALVDSPVLR